ncbi:type II toxin-antitoxin system YoeB family toxin [Mucilaginibacter sp.]
MSGSWSLRINSEHRLVYQIFEDNIIVILEIQSLKGHY